MRSDLIVVSTPSLAFSGRFVEGHEPVRIEALGAELTVQALNEGVVGRFARSAVVERDVVDEGPEVELFADELRPVVEPNGLRISCPISYIIGTTFYPSRISCADQIEAGQVPDAESCPHARRCSSIGEARGCVKQPLLNPILGLS